MHSNTKRLAVTGLATALVSGGVAAGTTSAAHADSVWDRVAACESGGNWSINTGNGFHGGLQFTQSTWRAYGGSGSAHNASKSQQIAVAKRVLAGQGPGAWPVCSRKAGLTRGNGGADSSSAVSRSTHRTAVKSTTKHAAKPVAKKVTSHKVAVKQVTSKKVVLKKVTVKHVSKKTGVAKYTKVSVPVTVKTVKHVKVANVAPKAHVHAVKSAKVGSYFSTPAAAKSIKTIQAKLGVAVDGVVGPQTTRAIQAYVGVAQDGIFGRATARAIEKKVGAHMTGARTVNTHDLKILAAYLAK